MISVHLQLRLLTYYRSKNRREWWRIIWYDRSIKYRRTCCIDEVYLIDMSLIYWYLLQACIRQRWRWYLLHKMSKPENRWDLQVKIPGIPMHALLHEIFPLLAFSLRVGGDLWQCNEWLTQLVENQRWKLRNASSACYVGTVYTNRVDFFLFFGVVVTKIVSVRLLDFHTDGLHFLNIFVKAHSNWEG